MATFITSKAVGETINIYAETSTGFWKYNHDGSDSSANSNGWITNIPVTNSNGEFTIMSCDSDGTVNGGVTILYLGSQRITSFNGTGLSSLITLELNDNQLTSFYGTGLSSLTRLVLESNLLTSFDGNGLTSLTQLALQNNLITSFDGTGLSSLNSLYLGNNLLTIFDITGLSSLHVLYLNGNPMTPSANNQILQQLNQHGVSNGSFSSNNGRTAESNTYYNNLVSLGWSFSGLDLPIVGNGKLRVRGVISTPSWNGGVIYNIGAVVTHGGQTWHCIQYAPAGYGPFGGYIDVYWSLGGTPPPYQFPALGTSLLFSEERKTTVQLVPLVQKDGSIVNITEVNLTFAYNTPMITNNALDLASSMAPITINFPGATGLKIDIVKLDSQQNALDFMDSSSQNYLTYGSYAGTYGQQVLSNVNGDGEFYNNGTTFIQDFQISVSDWLFHIIVVKVIDANENELGILETKFVGSLV